jgi:hypothetical protein
MRRFVLALALLMAIPVIAAPLIASLSVPALADPNDNGGNR